MADDVGRGRAAAGRDRGQTAVRGRARSSRTQARTPRPSLSREQVVDAALHVLDADGWAGLSMRRVAQHLGVGTMSLYWHVQDREELLDLVFDAVVDEQVLVDVPSDWRGALRSIAAANRAIFERYPWMLDGGPRPHFGVGVLEHVEQSVAATESMGLPFEARMLAVSLVDHFVLGFSMEDRRHGHDEEPRLTAEAREALASGQLPRAQAAFEAHQLGSSWSRTQEFEAGLEVVLDGIAAMVERGAVPDTGQPRRPARKRRRA